jgi:hypothetical protein
MRIVTREYALTTKDEDSLEKQRLAMDSFVFTLGVNIDYSYLMGQNVKELNHLPVRLLYPEHNEHSFPILLAKQVQDGFDEKNLRQQGNLRRIYQLGRSTLSLRCIPNFEKQIDELQFIFSGMYSQDIKPAVKAIEGIVARCSYSKSLDWYKQ